MVPKKIKTVKAVIKPRKKPVKRFNIKVQAENHSHAEAKAWIQEHIGPTWKDGDNNWMVRQSYYSYARQAYINNGKTIYSFRNEKDAMMFALRWAK